MYAPAIYIFRHSHLHTRSSLFSTINMVLVNCSRIQWREGPSPANKPPLGHIPFGLLIVQSNIATLYMNSCIMLNILFMQIMCVCGVRQNPYPKPAWYRAVHNWKWRVITLLIIQSNIGRHNPSHSRSHSTRRLSLIYASNNTNNPHVWRLSVIGVILIIIYSPFQFVVWLNGGFLSL